MSFKNLFKLPVLLLLGVFVFNSNNIAAQSNKIISGTVTSATGEALSAASIKIKGTSTGTVSNDKGEFSIAIPANAVLIITHIGYKLQEVIVKDQTNITVLLEDEKSNLSDIVVIGYGTVKKK